MTRTLAPILAHRAHAIPTTFARLLVVSAVAGMAAVAAPTSAAVSRNVTLMAHLDNYDTYSACCSYVHSDGREYAVLGTTTGTSIVNVTDPAAPYEVAFIPGLTSQWREAKQYRDWIYVSTEATGGGIQIIRMTDPENPVLVNTYTGTFNRAHTVSIDSTRALLTLNGTRLNSVQSGMRILSLAENGPNGPENPVEVGSYTFDYVHDSWTRNDTLFASCIVSNTMRIFDLSDPTFPLDIVSWTYPGAKTHSAETSQDGRYLYTCDEVNYGTMKVFDLANLFVHPMLHEITVNPLAIVHNVHVRGDLAYVAYYTEGVRLFDLHDPSLPVEWGYYDTYGSFSGGFHGVWEVAPFPSGTFIGSDIETGLYIFRATPNYGTIKVKVKDGAQAPLSGVDVTALARPDSTQTQGRGLARLALAPGSYTLRLNKFGYNPVLVPVDIALGEHDSIEVTLPAAPVGSISGFVRRSSDSAGLADATIEAMRTPLRVPSGSQGAYAMGGVPPNTYTLRCDRPGYAPEDRIVTMQPSGAMIESWSLLAAAWYDSCDANKGWSTFTPGDDAIDGLWTRAEPVGTTANAARSPAVQRGGPLLAGQHPEPGEGGGQSAAGPVQPDDDYTPGTGFCFVTGNGLPGGLPADSDIDNGRTTLTSPGLNLLGMTEPTIGCRWWYSMNTPGEPDSFLIEISANGSTWARVKSERESHAHWHHELIRVKDYIVPSATVKIRFIASDYGLGSIVDAAVDDIEAHDAGLVPTPVTPGEGTASAPPAVLGAPHPNPSAGSATVSLRLRDAAHARVRVYDVAGRWVATLYDGQAPAGDLVLTWKGADRRGRATASGVYWVRAEAAGEVLTTRLVRAR